MGSLICYLAALNWLELDNMQRPRNARQKLASFFLIKYAVREQIISKF